MIWPAASPRLRLQTPPPPTTRTPLDGGWWPRSGEVAAELPGLILALQDHSRGLIGHLMLGPSGWDSRPRTLGIAGRLVQLGWFDTLPAGLLTALYTDGRRVDLLTIPSQTHQDAAAAAMELAAHPANHLHAPDLLTALATPATTRSACPPPHPNPPPPGEAATSGSTAPPRVMATSHTRPKTRTDRRSP